MGAIWCRVRVHYKHRESCFISFYIYGCWVTADYVMVWELFHASDATLCTPHRSFPMRLSRVKFCALTVSYCMGQWICVCLCVKLGWSSQHIDFWDTASGSYRAALKVVSSIYLRRLAVADNCLGNSAAWTADTTSVLWIWGAKKMPLAFFSCSNEFIRRQHIPRLRVLSRT